MASDFRPTPSGISTFETCQLQFKFFHVDKVIQPPGVARLYGTALHKVILETDQKAKIESGQYRPLTELKEMLSDDIRTGIATVPDNDEEIQRFQGREQTYVQYQKFGLSTLEVYNQDRGVLSGRSVETPFEVPFADTTLHGRIDVDVSDTRHRDLKTKDLSKKGARRVTQEQCDENVQVGAYAAAKAKLSGAQDQITDLVYACKASDASIQTFSTVRTAEDHKVLEEKVYLMHKVYDAGAFYPVARGHWVCSEKFCGVWPADAPVSCPFGQRAQVTVGFAGGSPDAGSPAKK